MNVKMSLLSCLIWSWQSTSELSTRREEDLESRQSYFSEKKQRKPKCYSLWPGMQSDAGVGSRTKPEWDTGRLWGKRENVGPLSLKPGKLFTGARHRTEPKKSSSGGLVLTSLTLVELQWSRLQRLFEDKGVAIRSWKDEILEKGGFEREANPQCVAAFSFWAITPSGCGSKSLRIQGKGLGRGPLLKGRETSQGWRNKK